ncbi:MAG TPA: GNAT family N-acetyltransferase [Actinomycetota bacterium]|nr:GNAT family N-acetyltransferase [Actinomycetota bacterium]
MEIRRLGARDGAVMDAAVRAFHGFELQTDPAFLADPRSLAFVALDGETVVGFAWGFELPQPVGGPSDLLCGLEVAEAVREHGVGKELLGAFVAGARARGATKMWMLTNAGHRATRLLFEDAPNPGEQGLGPWWVMG